MKRNLFLMALIFYTTNAAPGRADWPCFRGKNHDGISTETGFKKEWKEPIPKVWDREVGSAFSSFACVGDRVYTCGTAEGSQVLICLDANKGDVIWQTPIEKEYHERQGGDGTRATPAVDGNRVYILCALGALQCRDADTGTLIWQTSFGHAPKWGYSGSVLIEGDLAIACGGESDGALAAFNKVTGQPAWKCGDAGAGYATPYPFTFGGKRYIVGFAANVAVIAEAETGRQVWRQDWKTDWGVNAASPIFHDGYLFLSSGYSTGCGLFKLRAEGDALAAEEVWKNKVFMNKFQSCILRDGMLFASDQKALVCADFMTGAEKWRIPHIQNATALWADGHWLLLTEKGQLQIAPTSGDGFEPVTKADLFQDRCWSVPVLHRGKLFARDLTRVACYDLSR